MDNFLHIVCHDIPWPVDHGGYVDLFYKIKSLSAAGIKIHLHCFYSNRNKADELNKYCVSVNYYKRKKFAFSLTLPYIVNSRRSKALLQNLKKDNFPVLLEGIHCTYELFKNNLIDRTVFVRLHNVEFLYYLSLSKCEEGLFKRLYFKIESSLLRNYEKQIANKALFLTVSEKDRELYNSMLDASTVEYLPVFIEQNQLSTKEGKGDYCLYHGNLSVNENEVAAIWLTENVFRKNETKLIIAGRNPSSTLQKQLSKYKNIELISNPSAEEINSLIENAQINILPSFNNTGVKLKIINALFKGRFCLVNSPAVENSGLKSLCNIAETPDEMRIQISELFNKSFSQKNIEDREKELNRLYNNDKNAKRLIALLLPSYL